LDVPVLEEPAARPRVDDAGLAGLDAEPPGGRLGVAADDDDGAAPHVLLLAYAGLDAARAVAPERLGRVLEVALLRGRLRRRRRRGEVGEPAGVGGEPAHRLERGGGLLFVDDDLRAEPGLEDALPGYVGEVEPLGVEGELRREVAGGRPVSGRPYALDRGPLPRPVVRLAAEEGPGGLGVRPACRDRDQRALGPPERRELPAEDAPRVDVDRVVDPLGLGDGRVAVDDGGLAAVPRRPVVADGEPERVGLAGGVAEEGEGANG